MVLLIMGLIGLLVYGPIFNLIRKGKIKDGQDLLEQVADQFKGQVAVSGRLPDPDPGGVLPAGMAQADPWGRPVLYWLAPELAGAGRISRFTGSSLAVRVYRNVGSGGPFPAADAALVGEAGNLALVLVSTGPDLRQQVTVTRTGGQTVINVLQGGGNLQDVSGTVFDDLVQSVSLGELKALIAQ